MSSASEVVVTGLAEQIAKLEAEKSKSADKRAKEAVKVAKLLAEKREWAQQLHDGTLETAKGVRHNPNVFPDTVRQSADGELVNGKPAKGWVVTIRCESCGDDRLINLQDAFQVTRCTSSDCRKKGSSKSKIAARTAEISQLSEEEQQALLEQLQAEIQKAA